MCSTALIWGMGYSQFWHCTWTEYFAYFRKYELEQDKQDHEFDYMAWWQGQYFAAALRSVYPLFNGLADPKKSPKYPYPEKPYSTIKPRTQEDEERLAKTSSLIQEHNLAIRAMLQKKQRQQAETPPD